jgi:hypothetical protein
MAPTKKVVTTKRTTRSNSGPAKTTTPIPKSGPKPTKKTTQTKFKTTRRKETEPINHEEEEEEEILSMTQQELDALVAAQVAEIVAMEASKVTGRKGKSVANRTTGGSSSKHGGSYKDFTNSKPLIFQGTEGAVGLLQWFEKTESVFQLAECSDENRVKFAAGTFSSTALSWWTAHTNVVGIDQANDTPWEDVKEMLRREYCPRGEIQKLEVEFWNLVVKGNDIAAYTRRFHELSVLCPTMVSLTYKKIERYIWGLPLSIQGNVMSSKPTELSEAIRLAHDLINLQIRLGSTSNIVEVMNVDNKRKWDGNGAGNFNLQPFKRTNTINSYNVGSINNNQNQGNRPPCNKCKRHHQGLCKFCDICKKYTHSTRECKGPVTTVNCFHCGGEDHWRNTCPKLNVMQIHHDQ